MILGGFFLKDHIHTIPVKGGEYTEGLVGLPKHVNPLYATMNDVDNDITKLLFSSLFKRDKNGELVKDLVTDYKVGEDGKNYLFQIRTDVVWHNQDSSTINNQEKLTVDDIIYTFNTIKDAQYNSPLRNSFTGVEISKVNNETIRFNLTESYAAFLNLLDFGIIPQDRWYSVQPAAAPLAELNLKPIGSGPYKFRSLAKDKLGAIKLYNLVINEDYYGTKPKIENLSFKFFSSIDEAVNSINENLIDGISYLPEGLQDSFLIKEPWNFYKLNLSQLTAIFLNQDDPMLKSKSIREALAYAVNKQKIIDRLQTEYNLIDGPILSNNFAYNSTNRKYNYNKKQALKILNEYGWQEETITEQEIATSVLEVIIEDEPLTASSSVTTSTNEALIGASDNTDKSLDELIKEEINKDEEAENLENTEENEVDEATNEEDIKLKLGAGTWLYKKTDKKEYLIIELTTVATEENSIVVESIKEDWESIGIKTIIKKVPANQMQADIIKPRNFTSLFYGQIVDADPDAYAFWHSSQASEKGLNIANYRNEEANKLLVEGRLTLDKDVRIEKYKKFQEIITNDIPAIFIYSPTYTYVQSKKIKGFDIENIFTPQDRFANINDWYIRTGKKFIW